MQFGKLPDLTDVQFDLPPDFGNPAVGPVQDFRIFIGGTVMFPPAWKNRLYPKGTKADRALAAYSEHFNTIELNATHYKIYPPEHLAKWRAQVPDSFRFCPKVPQLISHFRRLKNCEAATDEFIMGLLALEPCLGPTFLQMPPNFTPKHFETLQQWVQQWPKELPLAVELRHPDWFNNAKMLAELVAFLQAHQTGFVITDTPGRRDVMHMALTAPFLVLRFLGNEMHPSDEARARAWAHQINTWRNKGLAEVYVLVHQPDSVFTPETCAMFSKVLNGAQQG
jgi:uncharacterized protein YecE (DUF72 family)